MRQTIFRLIGTLLLAAAWLHPAMADDRIRIAFDDPLSGGNGNLGEQTFAEFVFYADRINAAGGVDGRKIEVVAFDNKSDPQEALVQAQKAIDQGFRFIAQGASASSVGAALTDFVAKHNARNPGQEVLYLNIAANDTALTNEKCQYWHFRFSSNNDMKTTALMAYMVANPAIRKVYLINPDYTAGRAVVDLAVKILKQQRPDIEIVGNDLVPIFKVTDFSPYINKVRNSGADAVITGAFAQDMALLMKAAADLGLTADWYTFYAMNPGVPTAMKQGNLAHKDFNLVDTFANNPPAEPLQDEFRRKYGGKSFLISGAILSTEFLAEAVRETHSTDPVVLARKLEGMRLKTYNGAEGVMQASDHQLYQDLYLTTFAPVTAAAPLDEEGTGWGWLPVKTIPAADTQLPTTCQMERP